MKIRPVGAELFHADLHTGRHDEADTPSSQFSESTLEHYNNYILVYKPKNNGRCSGKPSAT